MALIAPGLSVDSLRSPQRADDWHRRTLSPINGITLSDGEDPGRTHAKPPYLWQGSLPSAAYDAEPFNKEVYACGWILVAWGLRGVTTR
jgi:hypothetical protein